MAIRLLPIFLLLVALVIGRQQNAPLATVRTGELPIIAAPHGGELAVAGAGVRTGNSLQKRRGEPTEF